MTNREPVKVTNLDIYGNAALQWSRVQNLLKTTPSRLDITFFLGTVRPDGRPHSAGVGALWTDDGFFIVSGPKTRKSRNLAANRACTLSIRLEGIDLILEGEAHRITDKPMLEQAAQLYRESGWPAEVQDDAFTAPYSAPSAGPPPWCVYRFTFDTAFGVATAKPDGATRWRFKL
jgi:pyridoxamine 5'-phosphate oxidase-like protein